MCDTFLCIGEGQTRPAQVQALIRLARFSFGRGVGIILQLSSLSSQISVSGTASSSHPTPLGISRHAFNNYCVRYFPFAFLGTPLCGGCFLGFLWIVTVVMATSVMRCYYGNLAIEPEMAC